jgi:hypothetical protein
MSQDSMTAFNDAGNAYKIHVHRSRIGAGNLDNPDETVEGLASYRLTNGGAVNKVDDNTFQIVATGEVLRLPTS